MKATTETTQKNKDIAHPTIAVASKGPWLGTYIFHCRIEFSSNRLVTSPSTNDRCTGKLTEDAIHLMQIQSFKRFMTCISPVISTHSWPQEISLHCPGCSMLVLRNWRNSINEMYYYMIRRQIFVNGRR